MGTDRCDCNLPHFLIIMWRLNLPAIWHNDGSCSSGKGVEVLIWHYPAVLLGTQVAGSQNAAAVTLTLNTFQKKNGNGLVPLPCLQISLLHTEDF